MIAREIIDRLARDLWTAETERAPMMPIGRQHPEMTTAEAYDVQSAVADIRRGLGHRPCGFKIGLTSQAVREMVGLDEPDYGHLFEEMRIPNHGVMPRGSLIQPKIEPELAFVFARPLAGPDVGFDDVIAAIDYVTAAFEIVDCRIRGWQVRGIDAVCDNGSAARFVTGNERISAREVELPTLSARFERNGEVMATASLSEVMGNPVHAVSWLANKLATQNRRIEAGDIVLTGAPCRPADVAEGDVFRASFDRLGMVEVAWA